MTWATQRLREYLIKGFTMDDERLKELGGGKYFDELLARIRDIRSSEKVFWRKVLGIYATSVDYDRDTDTSRQFFATMQNKMHWAAHGHTAAEVIVARADAAEPNMGPTRSKEKGRRCPYPINAPFSQSFEDCEAPGYSRLAQGEYVRHSPVCRAFYS